MPEKKKDKYKLPLELLKDIFKVARRYLSQSVRDAYVYVPDDLGESILLKYAYKLKDIHMIRVTYNVFDNTIYFDIEFIQPDNQNIQVNRSELGI